MKTKTAPAITTRSSFPAERLHFVIITRWRLSCARLLAWQLLSDLSTWPRWWPQIFDVLPNEVRERKESLQASTFQCRNLFAYEIAIKQTNGNQEPKHLTENPVRYDIEYGIAGQLEGNGLWILEETEQNRAAHAHSLINEHHVYVTHRCEFVLHKTWMRKCAPLLQWGFSWKYKRMMRACALGMARQLHCEASAFTTWSVNKN